MSKDEFYRSSQWPEAGFLRLKQILAPIGPIPISRSSWWAGVKEGRFPQPVKLTRRVTAWRIEDIRELIDRLRRGSNGDPK